MNNTQSDNPPQSEMELARAMLQQVRGLCPVGDWWSVLEMLRVMALLAEDHPYGLLPALAGKSEDEILWLASQATEIIQTTETGSMVLRPPEVGDLVLTPIYTSQQDMKATLARIILEFAGQIMDNGPYRAYCARHLAKYLFAIDDPKLTLEILRNDMIGRLSRDGDLPVDTLVGLLQYRARCASEVADNHVQKESLLLAGTLAWNESQRTAAGNRILDWWRPNAVVGAVQRDNNSWPLTGEGVISLLALAEAAAHTNSVGLLAEMDSACAKYRAALREAHDDCVVETLKSEWASVFAGEVVAALADRHPDSALALHETLLAGATALHDMGPLFDYTAHSLTRMEGRRHEFCHRMLKATVRRSASVTPHLPARVPFPFSAICGRRSTAQEREQFEKRELRRAAFDDAVHILKTVRGPSKKMFVRDLRKKLNRTWQAHPPTSSSLIRDIVRFHDATGSVPDELIDHLHRNVRRQVKERGLLRVNPADDFRDMLKACRILLEKNIGRRLLPQAIDAVMAQPPREILFSWPVVAEFEFCSALLRLAHLAGPAVLARTWSSLWKAACKFKAESGEQMAGFAALLAEGSGTGMESVCELALNSLKRARVSDRKRLALRACLNVSPIGAADCDYCAQLFASLRPMKNRVVGRLPQPLMLARFLATCVDDGVIEPLALGPIIEMTTGNYRLGGRDKALFIKVVAQHITDVLKRRAMLSAMRCVLAADEHARLCLAVEGQCPQTLTPDVLAEANPGKLSDGYFAVYLDVLMHEGEELRETQLARLPAIHEASKRAMLIHSYIKHAKRAPVFETERETVKTLPADRIVCAAMSELPEINLDALRQLEAYAPYNLKGFRILHEGSRKVTTLLSEAFVSRQVERLCPSLRTGGQDSNTRKLGMADDVEEAVHADGIRMAEEILRCESAQFQLLAIDRIIGAIPARGRWVTAAFLDTIGGCLRSTHLPDGLVAKLIALPTAFDKQYHPAFRARLIRYFGDANAEARGTVWRHAKQHWLLDSGQETRGTLRGAINHGCASGQAVSILERATGVAMGCGMLPPADLPEEIVNNIRSGMVDLLAIARCRGPVCQTAVLSILLPELEGWFPFIEAELSGALAEVLDAPHAFRVETPDNVVSDFIRALTKAVASASGSTILKRVCSRQPRRWTTLFQVFAAKRDNDGDLSFRSEDLIEQLAAKTWPGEKVVSAWLKRFGDWDASDRVLFTRDLAPFLAVNAHGRNWAGQLVKFVTAAASKFPPGQREQVLQYSRSQILVGVYAKQPANRSEADRPIMMEADDYKRAWLCLRDAPDAPMQMEAALDILRQAIERDPPLLRGGSTRSAAIDLICELFSEHKWCHAMAEAALEALRAETSLAKRIDYSLALAKGLKSVAALRSTMSLLTTESLGEAIPGASPEDLKLIISAAAVFQIKSLYQTVDSTQLGTADEEVAVVQRHAQSYRRFILREGSTDRVSSLGLRLANQNQLEKVQQEASAFVADDVQWARDIAAAVEAVVGMLQGEQFPVQHWWPLARCARITRSPQLVKALVQLGRSPFQGRIIPNDVVSEVIMVLHDSVGSPSLPEVVGAVESFLFVSDPKASSAAAELPARLQLQIASIGNALV